jgi:hypothetical protein
LVSNFIENRRRQATDNGFDLGYIFNNQSIELYAIHPSSHNQQGSLIYQLQKSHLLGQRIFGKHPG